MLKTKRWGKGKFSYNPYITLSYISPFANIPVKISVTLDIIPTFEQCLQQIPIKFIRKYTRKLMLYNRIKKLEY